MWLDEPGATDARLSGAKASNLAVARQNGLPVLDGFVIVAGRATQLLAAHRPTGYVGANGNGSTPRQPPDSALFGAWSRLTRDGLVPLAVRSSSVIEDSAESSMAGRFLTVLHVCCWTDFLAAAADVVASAASVPDGAGVDAPMAVLVQPMGEALTGGVLFGVDPLTGDESNYLISYVAGAPEQIVSGTANGTQVRISRRGTRRSPSRTSLDSNARRQLARLARSTERLFGCPQDIEWLIDGDGTLRLLQSRPITASAVPVGGGHLLGSGPVSETFPDPLSPLERDLWEDPLDTGIREALRVSGTVSARGLAERFVVNVGGRVAVDLEALGVESRPSNWWHRLDPLPPARRVRAAWRIGRLRVAMPAIAHDLIVEVDADLNQVGPLDQLGDIQLLTVLDNAKRVLAGLHAHEVMTGFFVGPDTTTTGASVALTTVSRARLDGMSDAQIVASHPVTLALTPPRIGSGHPLPATPPMPPVQRSAPPATGESDDSMGIAREALRLRVRWVQELGAQVSMELGRRLCNRGQLEAAPDVRHLGLADLWACVENPGAPATFAAGVPPVAPLPSRFRLARDGSVVPVLIGSDRGDADEPIGVSAGRVVGVITHDPSAAAAKVLVVRTLDPALAGVIGSVAGLVSESGSPLSHLAILAREFRVPAVAAMTDATVRLRDGDVVLLDGTAGTVEVFVDETRRQPTTEAG